MEVVIGGEGESGCGFSFGVELDEFFSDILDFLFGFGLEIFPGFGAEFMELGFGAVFAGIFSDFVEGVDADVEDIIVFVNESDGFLDMAVDIYFFEAGVFADTVIDMGDEIAGLQFVEHPDIEGHFFGVPLFESVSVETFEDLVVGIAGYFHIGVEEPFMDGAGDGVELNVGVKIFENSVEAVYLFGVIGKQVISDTLSGILLEVLDEEVELFVECGLWFGFEGNDGVIVERLGFVADQDEGKSEDIIGDGFGVEQGLIAEKNGQIAFVEAGQR